MNVQQKRKPCWLKKTLPVGPRYGKVKGLLDELQLHTVCQEARCPNLGECFHQGTATFLMLGDLCTRSCTFCAVRHGVPEAPDSMEPERIAEMVQQLGLHYVVLTSVTRDDLADGGAGHFARAILCIRERCPGIRIEVLVPDFGGEISSLKEVLEAAPEVLNHNIETVPRLYPVVRPQAEYRRSLELLRCSRELAPGVITKSGLMLGIGEGMEDPASNIKFVSGRDPF